MTLTKFAVRIPHAGRWLYRSAGSRWSVSGFSDAQLWANADAAKRELKTLRARPDRLTYWDYDQQVPVDSSKAELVTVVIGEPR